MDTVFAWTRSPGLRSSARGRCKPPARGIADLRAGDSGEAGNVRRSVQEVGAGSAGAGARRMVSMAARPARPDLVVSQPKGAGGEKSAIGYRAARVS